MRTTVLRDHIFRAAHLNGLLGAHTGNYVVVTPSIVQRAAGANMSVDVGAFTYVLGGVFGAKTSTTNVVVEASDASPRIDLLYLATSGTLTVMKGTARAIVPTGETTWQKWEEPYPPDFSATDGILLAEIEVPGSATSILDANIRNIAVPALPVKIDSMASVEVFQRGTEVIARKADGTILDSGVVGTDDTDVFDAAVAECPDGGSIFIGPGTYTLLANKLFYLSGNGTTNPHYYAFGPSMEGKNCHVLGAGIDVTILKLANSQHYTDHKAILVFNRTTGDSNNGFTSFTLSNLTLDGNRDNQSVLTDIDGPGNYLSGSIRECELIYNVKSINSPGHGFYLGNNGGGPTRGAILNNLYIENCYRSGICTDTGQDIAISNCVITDCSTGVEILGNTDYATRDYDNISVSNVSCRRAGYTVWCINGLTMTGCSMDKTDVAVSSYGLQIHCSRNVMISDSQFRGNATDHYIAYIDGGGYIDDGDYTEVYIKDCVFDGYWALKTFGSTVLYADDCIFKGYTKVEMIDEEEVRTPGACLYYKEFSETITAKLYLNGCKLIADATDTYLIYSNAQSGSETHLIRCQAPNIGAFDVGGFLYAYDNTGIGLEGYNTRWRLEEGTWNATPTDSKTIAMTVDRTAAIVAGTPIKVISSAGTKYGIISEVGTNYLTVMGAALSGTISRIFLGPQDAVCQLDVVVPGTFGTTTQALFAAKGNTAFIWKLAPAYLVAWSHKAKTADSTSQPYVTPTIDGSGVDIRNSNAGAKISSSWVHSYGDANSSTYRIVFNDPLDIYLTTNSGTGDATYLTFSFTFVMED